MQSTTRILRVLGVVFVLLSIGLCAAAFRIGEEGLSVEERDRLGEDTDWALGRDWSIWMGRGIYCLGVGSVLILSSFVVRRVGPRR